MNKVKSFTWEILASVCDFVTAVWQSQKSDGKGEKRPSSLRVDYLLTLVALNSDAAVAMNSCTQLDLKRPDRPRCERYPP